MTSKEIVDDAKSVQVKLSDEAKKAYIELSNANDYSNDFLKQLDSEELIFLKSFEGDQFPDVNSLRSMLRTKKSRDAARIKISRRYGVNINDSQLDDILEFSKICNTQKNVNCDDMAYKMTDKFNATTRPTLNDIKETFEACVPNDCGRLFIMISKNDYQINNSISYLFTRLRATK